MSIDSEQDLRTIANLCHVANKLVFDEMEKTRAEGTRVVAAATFEMVEKLLFHVSCVCRDAVAKYEPED